MRCLKRGSGAAVEHRPPPSTARARLVRGDTAARLQAIDDGPVSTTTRSTLPSPPAAAQRVGTVASVDVPLPVSDPVPTVDPSELRADLLRGEFHHLEGGAGGAC